MGKTKKRWLVPDDGLWVWGTLKDFERHRLLDKSPEDILRRTPDPMKQDVLRLAPIVAKWLEQPSLKPTKG